jgi:hypothetical protein
MSSTGTDVRYLIHLYFIIYTYKWSGQGGGGCRAPSADYVSSGHFT